jgi:predicted permease
MTKLFQDVRYGLRVLLKSPGFSLIAVLTLGLGIGATTSLFSVVNGVLLDPLPYPKADQLVEIAAKAPPFSESSVSYPNFLDWVRENHTFESLAGYRPSELSLTGSGDALELKTMQVSASFFPLLGVQPIIGRNFAPEEDKRRAAPVVMLSYGLWKTKFGGSPAILGKTLTLSGRGYRVIGVVPANFYFCCEATDFRLGDAYTPIGSWDNPDLYERSDHMGTFAVGRVKPGVTVKQARADMDRVARDLAAEYPDVDKKEGVWIAPLQDRMVQDVKPMLLVLLAAVGFVLLIACANVANLLLARAMGRRREFAIRSVLGASRRRVVRQLLTESLLLSIAGGGLGLLFASWGTQAGLNILPEALPRAGDVRMDLRVLIFTLGVTVLASILFGLAPALRTSRSDLHTALKEGGRAASSARHRTQAIFVVAELALAVVLLVGAGLTLRSLAHLWSIRLGFNPKNVETFTVTLPPPRVKGTPEEVWAGLRQLTAAISSIPGVESASLTDGAEPMHGDDEWLLWIEGRPKPESNDEMISALSYIVSPGYWKTMQIPLLRGRLLTERDNAHSPAVCVIDENFARQYFADQDPIGQRLNVGGADADQQYEIVGVVGHVNQWGLDSDPTGPVKIQLYTLVQQFPAKWTSSASFYVHDFVARTDRPNYPSADAIRGAIERMNSEQVAYDFESEDRIVSDTLASRWFGMILLGAFAAVALVLASIGIYGVMSYVAGERTHEIGIRMALGAQREDVLKIVMADAARMTLIGVPIGLAAAAILTAQMREMLFGVSATDAPTFAGVAILLSVVALAACYVPAQRAMRVDPNVALRCE